MADWYSDTTTRADSVAQIVTDLGTYITTDKDGKTIIDLEGFMALAATRIAAIPDPSTPDTQYVDPRGLRGTNVRTEVEALRARLSTIAGLATGEGSVDLAAMLKDIEQKSAAVTAYYDRAYSSDLADLLLDNLTSGPVDKNMPAADDTTTESRSWIITYVSDRGEEGAPSIPTEVLEVGPNDTVTVTRPSYPTGRNLSYWRIYRSNSSDSTDVFEYVPTGNDNGVAIATSSFTDDVANEDLQEACPSSAWAEPPANLAWVVTAAQGFQVGFFENVLCFSEPRQPHAWPLSYRKTVAYPIVGLATWKETTFVATRGKPYFCMGPDPANQTIVELDSNQACVSWQSIYSTERGVLFASPDGMCLATPAGVALLTDKHFTRKEWNALSPSTCSMAEHDGVAYIFLPGTQPTVSATTITYAEGQSAGTVLGTVTTTGTPIAYRFSATGTTTSSDTFYSINSSGQISLTSAGAAGAANDYETNPNTRTHSVQVRGTSGLWSTAAVVTLTETDNAYAIILEFTDANGTTLPADTGDNPVTLTRNGTPIVNTDATAPAGVSAYFDGAGDYWTKPNTGVTISGAFTLRAKIYVPVGGTNAGVFGWNGAASAPFGMFIDNGVPKRGTTLVLNATTSYNVAQVFSNNTWHDVEWSRDGSNTLRCYIDGVLANSWNSVSATVPAPTSTLMVGRYTTSGGTNYDYAGGAAGRMRGLKLLIGSALHTSNFTPDP